MIEVYPLVLTQAEFSTAPRVEREFYLELGLISNEISCLNRLTLFALRDTDGEVKSRAGSAQAMLFLRLLAGRLYEGYPLITSSFKHLKVRYRSAMKGEGIASYNKLNTYFGDSANLIKTIRHKLAFHSDKEAFRAGISLMDDDEDIVDYMCLARGNSLFWGAEAAMICALKRAVQTDDAVVAYDRLLKDINSVSGAILDFTFAFALGFFKRNFPDKLPQLASKRIVFEDNPELTAFSLLWFFDSPTETPRPFPTGGFTSSHVVGGP